MQKLTAEEKKARNAEYQRQWRERNKANMKEIRKAYMMNEYRRKLGLEVKK